VLKTKNSSGKVDATSTGLGFGFVRFTCAEDASDAAREMSGVVTEIAGRKYKLQVEVAKPSGAAQPAAKPAGEERPPQTQEEQELGALKRTARVIVRNLSFYAKASHVRAALEGFGDIVELALPTVKTGDEMKGGKGKQQKSQHRGFAFVTFKTAAAAKAAVDRCAKEGGIEIRGRKVAVDVSVPKHMHEEGRRGERKAEAERGEAERGEAAGSGDDDDSDGDDGDDGSDGSDDSDDSESDGEDSASPKKGPKKESSSSAPAAPPKDASEKCTAFVRNVPFDVTDRDLFSLFKTYGAIAKVFVVLDPATGMGKGSAFVKFKYRAACERALEAARADETSPFVAAKAAAANVSSGNDGIMLNGRRLLVDLAVDRETAGGLKVERDENGKALKKAGKDRRNL
jgi:nucleolar protein 4